MPAAEDTPDKATAEKTPPRKLVFRLPQTSLLAVGFVLLFAIPFASGWPWLWFVYVFPLAAGYTILRLRTEVDGDAVTVRSFFGTKRIPWSRIRSLRVSEKSWLRAVTESGEVRLPAVRTRHLPALSLISGGRISDPVPD